MQLDAMAELVWTQRKVGVHVTPPLVERTADFACEPALDSPAQTATRVPSDVTEMASVIALKPQET
jgi:hypothetical protein